MTSLYRDMENRLKACRTQEDVDSVVMAGHQCLNAQEFGKLLPKVRDRRNKLREMGVERA